MCYSNTQYLNRLRKLDALRAEIKRLQAEADAVRDDIVNDMSSEALECDAFKMSAKLCERKTVDRKEVEKRLSADEFAACLKASVYIDFRFTLKGGKA